MAPSVILPPSGHKAGQGIAPQTVFPFLLAPSAVLCFGTILGFASGVMMVGQISGPPLAGWVFDTWGSYQGIWFGLVSLTLLGLVLALTTPRIGNTVKMNDNPRT